MNKEIILIMYLSKLKNVPIPVAPALIEMYHDLFTYSTCSAKIIYIKSWKQVLL